MHRWYLTRLLCLSIIWNIYLHCTYACYSFINLAHSFIIYTNLRKFHLNEFLKCVYGWWKQCLISVWNGYGACVKNVINLFVWRFRTQANTLFVQFTFIAYVFCAQEYGNLKSTAIFTQEEGFFCWYLQKGNFDSPKNKLNAISDFPNSEHPKVTSPLYTTVYIAHSTEFRILMMTAGYNGID